MMLNEDGWWDGPGIGGSEGGADSVGMMGIGAKWVGWLRGDDRR